MGQDLRKLFDTEKFPKKELPENHVGEFAQKLQNQAPKKKSWLKNVVRIAASIAILFTVGYFVLNGSEDESTPLQKQVAEMEKTYLKQIDEEWQTFVDLANDPKLVDYYKDRLNRLKEDYNQISVQFNQEPNSILILEELIQNLQQRLELIKSIQEHIQELNQKNTSNETIYL
jgi:Tfp pilus assembly protein PilN